MRDTRGTQVTAHMLLAALILGATLWAWLPARAEDARSAVPVDVAPMTDLFSRVADSFPGQILRVDLVRSGQPAADWVYEVKVLSPAGDVIKLSYDARTLALNDLLGRVYADADERNAETPDGDTARDRDTGFERGTDSGSGGGDSGGDGGGGGGDD